MHAHSHKLSLAHVLSNAKGTKMKNALWNVIQTLDDVFCYAWSLFARSFELPWKLTSEDTAYI